MASHDVDDGTGGMDASIMYELDRPQVYPSLKHKDKQPGIDQPMILFTERWNRTSRVAQ